MKVRLAVFFLIFTVVLLPGLAQDQPFAFMMLADPQFGMYTSDKGFVRETANYEFAVAAVNRLKPGFVIILGDMVNKGGDPDETREFYRISGKIAAGVGLHGRLDISGRTNRSGSRFGRYF